MKIDRLEVLSQSEIKQIHQHTLELLENTGIKVMLKKMRNLLAECGCQVDENSKIVKFAPEIVEEFVKKAPTDFMVCGADPDVQWRIGPDTRVWARPSGCWTPQSGIRA